MVSKTAAEQATEDDEMGEGIKNAVMYGPTGKGRQQLTRQLSPQSSPPPSKRRVIDNDPEAPKKFGKFGKFVSTVGYRRGAGGHFAQPRDPARAPLRTGLAGFFDLSGTRRRYHFDATDAENRIYKVENGEITEERHEDWSHPDMVVESGKYIFPDFPGGGGMTANVKGPMLPSLVDNNGRRIPSEPQD
jgi:hypothetical protein